MSDNALAVCETCGMPVRVKFDESGEISETFAVCGHVKKEMRDERTVSEDG